MVFHAHIINIHSVVHKSLLFRNEEKLVALLVYSSFIREATSGFRIKLSIKGKMPPLAPKKHLSVHFFLHVPRLLHISTEEVRVRSVRNRHESDYSRAGSINNNIKKRSKKFSIRGKYYKHIEN